MGNITDDIRQHFDTFAELPFTEADSLALSLSLIHISEPTRPY